MPEKIINGTRYVRIRPVSPPIGLGLRIRMWRVTNLDDRARIGGMDHLSREAAARWVTAQGWRYLGHQEPEAKDGA